MNADRRGSEFSDKKGNDDSLGGLALLREKTNLISRKGAKPPRIV
jgi:hypothetical protein